MSAVAAGDGGSGGGVGDGLRRARSMFWRGGGGCRVECVGGVFCFVSGLASRGWCPRFWILSVFVAERDDPLVEFFANGGEVGDLLLVRADCVELGEHEVRDWGRCGCTVGS